MSRVIIQLFPSFCHPQSLASLDPSPHYHVYVCLVLSRTTRASVSAAQGSTGIAIRASNRRSTLCQFRHKPPIIDLSSRRDDAQSLHLAPFSLPIPQNSVSLRAQAPHSANNEKRLEEHIDRHARVCVIFPCYVKVLTPVPMNFISAEYCLLLL